MFNSILGPFIIELNYPLITYNFNKIKYLKYFLQEFILEKNI